MSTEDKWSDLFASSQASKQSIIAATELVATIQPKQYFCVLDFEASCWQTGNRDNMEIIEFPSVLGRLDGHQLVKIAEFQHYVRPVIIQELSQFCTELTGIQQTQVDNANAFPDVYTAHHEWLKSYVGPVNSVVMVTCGSWDLKTMLPMEFKRYPELPRHPEYSQYMNIKQEFERLYGTGKITGMTGMLRHLKMELLGRHHSGIDDCRNIYRVLERMVSDGYYIVDGSIQSVDTPDPSVAKNQALAQARRAEKMAKRNKGSR